MIAARKLLISETEANITKIKEKGERKKEKVEKKKFRTTLFWEILLKLWILKYS